MVLHNDDLLQISETYTRGAGMREVSLDIQVKLSKNKKHNEKKILGICQCQKARENLMSTVKKK